MSSIMSWKPNDLYHSEFKLGSEGQEGEHRRDIHGWPFSIYLESKANGVTDICLCVGIQNIHDAKALQHLLNNR